MKLNLKYRLIRKKAQKIKEKTARSISGFTPIHLLIKSRRAVNTILSNLMLIAAVIAVGFTALAFANSVSNDYQSQYGQSINSDINKMKEELSFEYAFYNTTSPKSLYIYLLNSGSIDVNITAVLIDSSSQSFSLYSMNRQLIQNQTIASAKEAYLQIYSSTLAGSYTIKITTSRGSIFAYKITA